MEITTQQFKIIENLLPIPRGNVKIPNLQVLNAVLYVAEHGCKWRGLPKKFGRWHSIYMRANRWAKQGVLDQVFLALQENDVINIQVDHVSLDSTAVKVHPDGTGALKKRSSIYRQVESRLDHQDSYGCSRSQPRSSVLLVAGAGRRCA
jgi:transposase